MVERNYTVKYDIVADAGKAIEAFTQLQNPLINLKREAHKLTNNLVPVVTKLNEIWGALDKIQEKSNIKLDIAFDVAAFNNNLKQMELNAKASANRIRGTFESIFKDTHNDYLKKQSLLGTPIEQSVSAGDKELKRMLKMENSTAQSLIGKMKEARRRANIYAIAKRNMAGDVSDTNAINSISQIWKKGAFGKTTLLELRKSIRDGLYDSSVFLDEAEKKLWKSLNASNLAPLKNNAFLDFVDVARDNTDKIKEAIEERKKLNVSRIASVKKEQRDIAKNMKPLMGGQNGGLGSINQTIEERLSGKAGGVRVGSVQDLQSKSEAISKIARSINRLSKLPVAAFSYSLKIRTENSLSKLNTISKKLDEIRSKTSLVIKVTTKGASKQFSEGVRQIKGMTIMGNRFLNSIAQMHSAGIVPVTGEVTSVVTPPGKMSLNPIEVLGEVTKIINATKEAAGSVNVLGEVTKIINSTAKAAGTVSVIGEISKAVNKITKAVTNVPVEGLVETAKAGKNVKFVGKNIVGITGVINSVTFGKDADGKSNKGSFTKSINVKAKVTGLTNAIKEANAAFQNRVKTMKNAPAIRIPIQLKWGTGQENMQAQIKKMQSSIPALKVGVNLELAKAQIDELAAYIQKKGIINMGGMSGPKSQGQFRNYRPGSNEGVSYVGGGGGGRRSSGGNSGGMVYGGGSEGNFLTRLRRFAYPLTGNLSYGASSPMALQMFKDMPIMMGVGGAIGAITGGISNSFEYQDTMRVARSILERGYKGDNFERDYRNMEVTARNVARQTKFTAPEAAEAVRFMAMAGLDIPRINSSIKPISDIALIGRNNLGDIADIMTNVQTTYKISPDKMERMADAMANTFTKTNVDMMMIAESLKYAGGIAQLTGTSLGDSLAMIGIMGNNGIQGSMAGTSTRMMMQNMIRPNKNQAAMWAKIGVNTRDENGFVKDPIKLLGELRNYVDKKYGSDAYMKLGKGEEFKNKALGDLVSNMFRVTSTAGVAALLRDYDKLVQLSASNRSSDINGLAGQLSEKQQNEVKGLIAKISSSFQEQILQIIEKNTGWIKQKLVDINEWVSSPETQKKLESLIDTLKNIVQGFINVGEVALWAYEKFNKIKIFGDGLVDTLIKFQLYMSALGSALRLVLSPLNIFSGFNFGRMGAAGAGAAMGSTGFAAFAGTGIASLFNSRRRSAFDRDYYFNNPYGWSIDEAIMSRHHGKVKTGVRGAGTLGALDALIARRQMQAYAASRIVGGNNPDILDRALRVKRSREAEVARLQAIRNSVSSAALAQALKQRRSEQLLDSVLISQFMMRKGFNASSFKLAGSSIIANVNAGKALGAFRGVGSIGGGLITSLTSGVMGLAKAFGLLISPIGLVTMAIGGLGAAAYYFYKRHKESKEALQNNIEGLKKVREITNKNTGFDTSALPDSSPLKLGIARISANKDVIRQSVVKNNPLLKNNPIFKKLLDPGKMNGSKDNYKYVNELYDTYIAPGLNEYGGEQLLKSQYLDEYGRSWVSPTANREFQAKALRGATMLQGSTSNRVNAWANYVKNQANKIFAIKDADKRNKAWEDLEKRINEVSERYKKQAENLQSVTDLQKKYGDNLKNARSSEIMNTSEYRIAEAGAIGKLMKDLGNTAVGQYLATHVLDSGIKDKSGAAIRAIVNGLKIGITGNNGKELVSSLSFDKNGKIDWNKLQETLKKNGVDFALTLENKFKIVDALYGLVKDNPYYGMVKQYLSGILSQLTDGRVGFNFSTMFNPAGEHNLNPQYNVDNIVNSGGSISGSSGGLGWSSNIGSKSSKKSGFGFNGGSGLGRKAPDTFLPKTTTQMKNDKYGLLSYSSSGISSKNNIVVNVGGITVNNDADMNEIETRIEKGVLTAMNAVLVDQSNNSMYNI